MPDLSHRSRDVEIMDDLECSGEVVHQTLRELEVVNRWLGGNHVTLDGIRKLLPASVDRTYTIADLGCGGGDMLRLVSSWASKHAIKSRLVGIDANPNIVAFARTRTQSFPEITYEAVDVMSAEFQRRKFDILLATLFVHHFPDDELIKLLVALKQQATVGIVINDIHRHWLAYYSIQLLTRLFSRSTMVRFDAPLSVRRAFRRRDLEYILEKAGIKTFTLRWKWAFRWQLIIPAQN